jgi:hypothetical protein
MVSVVENGDNAWGMDYRRASLFVRFLWAEGLNSKDVHKEIFPVYDRKCLPHKAVHNWVEKHGRRFADDEEVETEVRKWLRQQSEDLDTLVKQWEVYVSVLVEDMSWNIFSGFEYYMFYVLYPFVTYLLIIPHILVITTTMH